MSTISEQNVLITYLADVSQVKSATKDAQRSVNTVDKTVERANTRIKTSGKELGRVVGQQVRFNAILQQQFGKIGLIFAEVATGARAVVGAIRAAVIPALGQLGAAIAATGVGALVIALGALIGAFFSTQRGADALTRTMNIVSSIFQRTLGVLQNLSFELLEAFKNPKQALEDLKDAIIENLVNRVQGAITLFRSLADVGAASFTIITEKIKGVFGAENQKNIDDANAKLKQGAIDARDAYLQTLTGVENLIDKIGDAAGRAGDLFRQGIEDGNRLTDIQIRIGELESKRNLRAAQLAREEKELQLILRDREKSENERQEAYDRILQITEQQAALDRQIIRLRQEEVKIRNAQNDTGRKAQQELNDLKAEEVTIEDRILDKRRELIRQLNTINSERRAEAERAAKEEAERLAKLQELTDTQLEALKRQFQSEKELLGLNKDRAKLTELEIKALETLTSRYTEAIITLQKETQRAIQDTEDQITSETVKAARERFEAGLVEFRIAKLKELNDFEGTEREKQEIANRINREIAEFQIAQNQDLLRELESLDLEILSDQQRAETEKNINAVRLAIEELKSSLKSESDPSGSFWGDFAISAQRAGDLAVQSMRDTTRLISDQLQEQVSIQEERVKRFEELARTGSARQLEIEENRLAKLQEAQIKNQEKQRRLDQAQILQNQAVAASEAIRAIAASFKEGGVLGIVTGTLTAAALGIALASISQNVGSLFGSLPAFKEGTEYLQGPGTGTSDSIVARVSKGERIVPADTNSKIREAVGGSFPNHLIPEAVGAWVAMPEIKAGLDNLGNVMGAGLGEIKQELLSLREEQRKMRIIFGMHKGEFAAMISQHKHDSDWQRR
jgi:hypothetical protein